MKKFSKLIFLFTLSFFLSNQSFANWIDGNFVLLQGLDKISARIKTLKFQIGEIKKFGILNVMVKRCVFSKPTDTPESIAYITVFDDSKKHIKLKKTNIVFDGWMFASSPSLNAMEHPVYDLILIACKNSKTTEKGSVSK